ncbi:hypothetical protein EH138_24470 [Salmonella enterica subsp. enterica serovar Eastbourne]|uniref:Uncharacterized protein n=1 Tax=Salmonella enterica subsp. enterica serovar Eastbourne TaxID=486993 RepID=A0A702B5H4_SALET|nr:hypothetical protein [Salmonella enterica subsp. enterica serovar Eastbourne]ECA1896477.1 hypothetical protein [Salmonella enterica subsp. enterica serovar Eastbourne]HAC6676370.1 hypothetical protein [Salmonella enterica subsp. enterica serovar Eastbourne]HAE5114744.1 hypothetical protein [Salmonella enterica subsp. enterica serovar Eastbourne]HAE8029064.1 hypothetical protein [Salmonella enterica subsp. enterica serovar Eastbourne]
MATTIKNVVESFEYLFCSLYRQEFVKTLRLNECNERELLPLVRCYLLGWFGDKLTPEVQAKLPGTLTGNGYIDFVIDDIAVEFAVRRPDAPKATLAAYANSTEIKKLMKYDGKALLVLFDFSATPFTEQQIEAFKGWHSLLHGNHKKSAFNIAYFYVKKRRPLILGKIVKNIRIN